jgi:hypothetical protein
MRRGVVAVVVLGQFSLTTTASNQRQLCSAALNSHSRPEAVLQDWPLHCRPSAAETEYGDSRSRGVTVCTESQVTSACNADSCDAAGSSTLV